MQRQKFKSELQPQSCLRHSGKRRVVAGAIAAVVAVVTEAIAVSVQAASLTNWNFDPTANQLEITVKDGTTPRYFLMAQPARIVVDLPDTAVGDVSAQQTYTGAVRQIRVSQFHPGLTRIVMEIAPDVSLAPGQVKLQKVSDGKAQGDSRWVLQPLVTKALSANAVAANTVTPRSPVAVKPAPASVIPSSALKPETATTRETAIASAPSTAIPAATAKPSASSTPSPKVPALASAATPAASQPSRATSGSLPAPPPAASATPSDTAPAATTPSIARSVDLAPVLSSSPTVPPGATPLPPTAANAADSTVAVDTAGGVPISVPSPSTPTVKTPGAGAIAVASPSPAATPAIAVADSVSQPTSRIDRLLAIAQPAATSVSTPTGDRAIAQAAKPQTRSILSSLASLEIPTTLAATPTTTAPTVRVPPLTTRGAANAPSGDSPSQPRQADVETAAPPVSAAIGNQQPTVSVPPPIRVGTPSLGTLNGAPASEPAQANPDPASANSPTVSVPPLRQPASPAPPAGAAPSYDATTVRQSPASANAPTVNVPPLRQPVASPAPPAGATPSYDATTVRQSPASANLAPPIDVPSLQQPATAPVNTSPTYNANTVKQPPMAPAPTPVVEFGQPLPAASRATGMSSQPSNGLVNPSPAVLQAFKPTAPNVLLPTGTTLNLRYPGNAVLSLKADSPQQEVLVLQTEIRDTAGNILAPEGSMVTGRFETTQSGSRFITQAISLPGRTIAIAAQSDPLGGARQVEHTNLLRNSGIGVVAGSVLGAFGGSAGFGALGGAAAGAAATVLTAPKPALIQPGQIVQVRLTQDLH